MAKKSSSSKVVAKYRSAVTGKYVSKKYADNHPNTTVKERDKKKS